MPIETENAYEVPGNEPQIVLELIKEAGINSKQLQGFLAKNDDEYSMPDVQAAASTEQLEFMQGLKETYRDGLLGGVAESLAQQEEQSGYWKKREASREGSASPSGLEGLGANAGAPPPPPPKNDAEVKINVLTGHMVKGDKEGFDKAIERYSSQMIMNSKAKTQQGAQAEATQTLSDYATAALEKYNIAAQKQPLWLSNASELGLQVIRAVASSFVSGVGKYESSNRPGGAMHVDRARRIQQTLQTGRRRDQAGFGSEASAENSPSGSTGSDVESSDEEPAYVETVSTGVTVDLKALMEAGRADELHKADPTLSSEDIERQLKKEASQRAAKDNYANASVGVDAFGREQNAAQKAEADAAIAAETRAAQKAATIERSVGSRRAHQDPPENPVSDLSNDGPAVKRAAPVPAPRDLSKVGENVRRFASGGRDSEHREIAGAAGKSSEGWRRYLEKGESSREGTAVERFASGGDGASQGGGGRS